jgi:hypothetical protein
MRILGLICGAVLCLCAGMARAEDPFLGDWHVDLTSYVWISSLNGNVTARGHDTPVDASFIDILKDSDSLIGLEGRLGVSKGRFGVYIDGLYNKIGADNLSGPFGFAKIDATVTLTLIESAVYYRLVDLPRQLSPDGQDTWNWGVEADVYAGARYTNIGLKLDFNNLNQSGSQNQSWVDPIVGARVIVDLSDHWKLALDNNFGGFGVGSKFAYSGMGLVGYEFKMFGLESTAWAGYKGLYQDYENGSGKDEFKWNMWIHGPIIGTTIRFF